VRAGTLSRGLRQRLAIGQAIIHSPELVLLDEPAAGLDPEARHALAVLFRELQASGMTLVVSSHILAELDEYSTHMLVLRAGRIVEQRELRPTDAQHARRMHLTLASADERAMAVLSSQPLVSAIEADGATIAFAWQGEADAQASLLRALIESGLEVIEFGEVRENLHDSYLRTLAEPKP
jgi:ABC-2 type transport system ATP-binding protein